MIPLCLFKYLVFIISSVQKVIHVDKNQLTDLTQNHL